MTQDEFETPPTDEILVARLKRDVESLNRLMDDIIRRGLKVDAECYYVSTVNLGGDRNYPTFRVKISRPL